MENLRILPSVEDAKRDLDVDLENQSQNVEDVDDRRSADMVARRPRERAHQSSLLVLTQVAWLGGRHDTLLHATIGSKKVCEVEVESTWNHLSLLEDTRHMAAHMATLNILGNNIAVLSCCQDQPRHSPASRQHSLREAVTPVAASMSFS